jgi:hypothetical protein
MGHTVLNTLLSEGLRLGGPRWVSTRGCCMGGQFPRGAEVLLEPFDGRPPRIGELAVYRSESGLAVHRLCRRDADGWWANPDARLNIERTGPLIGRVRLMRHRGRLKSLPSRPGRAHLAWLVSRCYLMLRGRLPFAALRGWFFSRLMRLKLGPLSS